MKVNTGYSLSSFDLDLLVYTNLVQSSNIPLKDLESEVMSIARAKVVGVKRSLQLSSLVSADFKIKYEQDIPLADDESLIEFKDGNYIVNDYDIPSLEKYDVSGVDKLQEELNQLLSMAEKLKATNTTSELSSTNSTNEHFDNETSEDYEFTSPVDDFFDSDMFTLIEIQERGTLAESYDSEDEEEDEEEYKELEEEYVQEDEETYDSDEDEDEDYDSYFSNDSQDSDSEEDEDEDEDEDYDEYYPTNDFQDSDSEEDEDEDEDEDYDDYYPTNNVVEESVESTKPTFDISLDDFIDDSPQEGHKPTIKSNQSGTPKSESGKDIQHKKVLKDVVKVSSDKVKSSSSVSKEIKKSDAPKLSSAEFGDRDSEPKTLREFLRKHPHCEVSVVSRYFTKKEIQNALVMGKIIKKGSKLHI